jgi:SPP1 family predicted phage head-tail adaptor
MQSGKLDQVVTLYSPVNSRSGLGDDILTFVSEGDDWADVISVRGEESFVAARMDARRMIKVKLRFRDDIETTWRVRWDGQDYDIKDVDRSERRKGELWLMAQAVDAT